MDYQLNHKQSELILLRDKLEEPNEKNRLIAKRPNQTQSEPLNNLESLQPFDLCNFKHFVVILGRVVKSVRYFCEIDD